MAATSIEIQNIARIAHQANKALCEGVGDYSQPDWNDAPDWQKDSAINGVKFHLDNPDATDSASHDNWMAEKVKDGWIFGETKDPENKQHPCMVPFDHLPIHQQRKDSLFRAIVHIFTPKELKEVSTQVTDRDFNPSGDQVIYGIKDAVVDMEQYILDNIPNGRRRSVSLTKLEDFSMWAVKSAAVGDN
ncbi:hypothetical protein SUFG_00048 [Sulfitobacter phage phiCB2047-B]|uniref:Uncharacterized protein n=1 Tax=Sulfitobacter phage phiCB2047-B TaxID=754046 RepID=M4PQN8_9CAUD|nr:hypothetical protein SUFG_00048 [Sulfitobacter phage phiCB2047-B]AGH07415.1 hypothetical protein SUFG_00048 [Sulfitobacter phage phiCB2047-B]